MEYLGGLRGVMGIWEGGLGRVHGEGHGRFWGTGGAWGVHGGFGGPRGLGGVLLGALVGGGGG